MSKRIKTNYPGVFYREATRLGGKGLEKVFYIVFKKDGKVIEESWWLGKIIDVFPEENKVKVHYVGWSAEWDEVVPLNRVLKHP